MNAKNRNIITVIILAAVITVAGIVTYSFTGFFIQETDTGNGNGGEAGYEETLAKCLTAKGVKMYGAYWCGHCKNQKDMFGEAFQYIDYVECTQDQAACDAAGISGYPTWVGPDGTKYPGEKTLESLAQTFGCDI